MTSSARSGSGMTPGSSPDDGGSGVIEAEEDGVYYASHDLDADGLTTTVSLAVAEVADRSPAAIISDFADYVDPDGLNRVFRTRPDGSACAEGHIEFVVEGYRVRIDSSGEIAITPPSAES